MYTVVLPREDRDLTELSLGWENLEVVTVK